jgi:hypothetical protein
MDIDETAETRTVQTVPLAGGGIPAGDPVDLHKEVSSLEVRSNLTFFFLGVRFNLSLVFPECS